VVATEHDRHLIEEFSVIHGFVFVRLEVNKIHDNKHDLQSESLKLNPGEFLGKHNSKNQD